MQTDRQTDKSTRWAFTAYEDQYHLFNEMPDIVAEWGFQDEVCPDTGRKHKQGYIRTKTQQRFSKMRAVFPGVHLEVSRDWNKTVNYCKKAESRDPSGNQVHQINDRKFLHTHEALLRVAGVWVRPEITTAKDWKEANKDAYWEAVRTLLRVNPQDVGLYSNTMLLTAWLNTMDVWLEMVRESVPEEIDDASVSADFVSTE